MRMLGPTGRTLWFAFSQPNSRYVYLHHFLIQGLMGLAADGEEALLWLSRAARQLAEVVGDSADGGSSGSASGSGGGRLTDGGRSSGSGRLGATGAGAGRRPLPALMSESQCKLILSQVRAGFVPTRCLAYGWFCSSVCLFPAIPANACPCCCHCTHNLFSLSPSQTGCPRAGTAVLRWGGH